ncbi:flagellar assembly protein FliW [Sediminibacillus albus]|uniref:Flagellar assembly factor FliW n=1 Tax=Sediminibacillus albus TaxID=407036 RepID=A0A1G8YMJ0_9BACI|nr:flagellar assembly protein FliW [Sediminibacillus albus]SDK03937.1 flagellar assembly factor FliW [Sediminibacillus albus]
MKIPTKYFGELEIDRSRAIFFPQGIPGFNEEKEFILLDLPDNPVFHVLQSVGRQSLAFIVTNPYQFRKDYEFELDQSILGALEIEKQQDVAIFSILSLKDPFEQSTMNLQAPIVINLKNQRGKQYITNHKSYSTREPLAAAASSKKED